MFANPLQPYIYFITQNGVLAVKLKTSATLATITAVLTLSACAAVNESMNDVRMTFTSKEDRIAHWKEECRQMGATDEQLFDCALRQEEWYQRRLNE